jgi:hypothetical protein
MKKSILMGLIVGAIASAMVASSVVPLAQATVEKNLMGSETSENAKDKSFPEGSMGDHSKAGGAAGDPPYDGDNDDEKKGRDGLANALPGDGPDHPSEVIAGLCGDEGQNC